MVFQHSQRFCSGPKSFDDLYRGAPDVHITPTVLSPLLDKCATACILREQDRVAIRERPKITLEGAKPLRPIPVIQSLNLCSTTPNWAEWHEGEPRAFEPSSGFFRLFTKR